MRILFVHRVFPGQFGPLISNLVASPPGLNHQIVFISEQGVGAIPGVTRVGYCIFPASRRTHIAAQDFDIAQRRAQAVAEVARGLAAAGFVPDLVIGHEGWGEMLNLVDVWPHAPVIPYREYFYHLAGADVGFDAEFPPDPAQLPAIRAKNAVNLLGLAAHPGGVTPTAWQRWLYPAWAQPGLAIVPDAVDLAACRRDPCTTHAPFALTGAMGEIRVAPEERLVTYVARDLEPYRGFHTFMRALPPILRRPGTRVICVGGDGVSYGLPPPQGTWRQRLLAETGPLDRVHFPGRIGYADYLRLLRRSDVHAYLSYPFIASWSLREALASGCAVVAGDTAPVREFITDGVDGALVPCLSPDAVAARVLELLEDAPARAALGQAARARAEREMRLEDHLAGWADVIARAMRR